MTRSTSTASSRAPTLASSVPSPDGHAAASLVAAARSPGRSNGAGEACEALASGSASSAGRARWRAEALDWYVRSLEVYRQLDARGALVTGDAEAPREARELHQIDRAPGEPGDEAAELHAEHLRDRAALAE